MKAECPSFEFPLDKMLPRRSGLTRWAARRVAMTLWQSSASTYQFGGFDGALRKNYVLVNASKYQVIHWILREAGYLCSPADVMRICGASVDERREAEGCMVVPTSRIPESPEA